jgi:hypothetical protein
MENPKGKFVVIAPLLGQDPRAGVFERAAIYRVRLTPNRHFRYFSASSVVIKMEVPWVRQFAFPVFNPKRDMNTGNSRFLAFKSYGSSEH